MSEGTLPTGRPSGSTALVTGSTSGIGAATALRLARAGLHIVVSGRDAARGADVIATITAAGGTAEFAAVDLTAPPADLRAYATTVLASLGRPVDILVLNAAAAVVRPTLELSDGDIDLMLGTNLRSSQVLVSAFVPGMIEQGSGVVIMIGSWMGQLGTAGGAFYGATKAAQEQLVRGWAAEFGPRGIRVNAITPGMTLTANNAVHLAVLEPAALATPAQELVTPDDIAEGVLFLSSDAARHIHGATLPIDGGIARTRL